MEMNSKLNEHYLKRQVSRQVQLKIEYILTTFSVFITEQETITYYWIYTAPYLILRNFVVKANVDWFFK